MSDAPTASSARGKHARGRGPHEAELPSQPSQRRTFERELLYSRAADLLDALLAETPITQHELANRLGVSDARVSHLMRHADNITLRTLADIGWATGVRFELVPVPFACRTGTPADTDPAPSEWFRRLTQLLEEDAASPESSQSR